MELNEAKIPTMYFIGVSTGQSSSKNIFPKWVETLQISPARLIGIDLKIHDKPENYQKVINFIKNDFPTKPPIFAKPFYFSDINY